MKSLLCIFATLSLAITTYASPTHVFIEAHYKNFDPTFTRDVFDKEISEFSLPRVTVKSGEKAVINIIREIKVENTEETRNCGPTLEVTPEIKGDKIEITGKSIIRTQEHLKDENPLQATTFVARETFLTGTVKNNETITVKTSENSKEEIQITFQLINSDGKPAKP